MVSLQIRSVEEFYCEDHQSERHPVCRSAPDLSDFNGLKAGGFGSVINNRPDGEEPTQPAAAEASGAAEAAGLRYARQPIVLGAVTEADIRQFQKNLAQLDQPVFAHCKTARGR